MKKILTFVFVAIFVCSFASAEIDLSGMSFEELLNLRNEVQTAMMETNEWQEVVVPAGLYEIGVDIPAGHWTITAYGDMFVNVTWGDRLDKSQSGVEFTSIYDLAYMISSKSMMRTPGMQESVSWKLTEGTFIDIESGSVIFTPYAGTTFAFK